jgi:hypothetical protein
MLGVSSSAAAAAAASAAAVPASSAASPVRAVSLPSMPLFNAQLQPCVRLMMQDVLPFMGVGFLHMATPLCDIIAEYAQQGTDEEEYVAAALIQIDTRDGDCFDVETAGCASDVRKVAETILPIPLPRLQG